jgi:ElaB/YqjD/DUF883 family membrane-anchored ribosome-binding protein
MGMTKRETEIESNAEKITKKKLMEDLKTIIIDAEDLLKKAASDRTGEWIWATQAKAKKSLKAANAWLAKEEETAILKIKSAAKGIEEYVRGNTWIIPGMAAIAGLFFGILVVRLGLSAIEEGKRLVTQGGRAIQEVGKRFLDNGRPVDL